MSEIVLARGLPASGKSTFVEQVMSKAGTTTMRVERDLLRDQLFGTRHGLTSEQENLITQMQFAMAKVGIEQGKTVFVSDMNLRAQYVRQWAKFAAQNGARFTTFPFDNLTLDELIRRDANREHSVGADVIQELWSKFTKNGKIAAVDVSKEMSESLVVEPYDNPDFLTSAVIADIDGTVAKMNGRSPYEWMRVHEDEPVEAVISAVHAAKTAGYHIIFMSGRDSSCRDLTSQWLWNMIGLGPEDCDLFMRAEGDSRKDDLVKYELFNEHVRGKYHVKYVLDDRDQVVAMWRKLGLACFQVAEGNF